jgi:hypothetical protein
VIASAVRALPPEHFDRSGVSLERELRQRRDDLGSAAEELYRIVFRYADVQASDDEEVADVERRADGSLRIVVRRVGAPADVTFDRIFSPTETREVRLYMHGGADVVRVTGQAPGRFCSGRSAAPEQIVSWTRPRRGAARTSSTMEDRRRK